MFLPHPRVKVSIVGSLRDREVACSASDRQGSNFESCVWRTVSSQSSHHPQEVLLAQFSLYVHKGGLKPDSFHFSHPHRITIYKRAFTKYSWEQLVTALGQGLVVWLVTYVHAPKYNHFTSLVSGFETNRVEVKVMVYMYQTLFPYIGRVSELMDGWMDILWYDMYSALQRQTNVTAHYTSKQLLLFAFERHYASYYMCGWFSSALVIVTAQKTEKNSK